MITLDQFSALVADIYDAALDPALLDRTLKKIAAAAGGSVGGLLYYDRQQRRPHLSTCNLDPAEQRKYQDYYERNDPVSPLLVRAPAGVIVSVCAVTTAVQRRGEFYNDWATPNEIGDAVFVNLLNSPDGRCTLALCRPWGLEPFATPEMLRLVRLLAPLF